MNYNLEIELVPFVIKKDIEIVRKVSPWIAIGLSLGPISMLCFRIIVDLESFIIVTIGLLFFPMIAMLPGFIYYKTSHSKVRILDDQIQVISPKGECWRTIKFEDITDVKVEKIEDFFYGQYRHEFVFDYICIYLNNSTEKPIMSYNRTFRDKNFFMINYDKEAFEVIQSRVKRNAMV